MSTIIASNIPPSVSSQKVEEFFSFCGRIKTIYPKDKGSYEIEFESPKALSTAALLDNAELEGQLISVQLVGNASTSNVQYGNFRDDAPSYEETQGPSVTPITTAGSGDHKIQYDYPTHTGDASYDQVTQEEKPKYAIMAQLLASGYTLSDKVIERGLAVDNEKGYTQRAKSFLNRIDDKYIGTQKPDSLANKLRNQSLDKWHSSGYSDKFKSYLNRAASTPYGSKVSSLYETVCKEAKDIHKEALRLRELKKQQTAPGTQSAQAGQINPPSSPPLYTPVDDKLPEVGYRVEKS